HPRQLHSYPTRRSSDLRGTMVGRNVASAAMKAPRGRAALQRGYASRNSESEAPLRLKNGRNIPPPGVTQAFLPVLPRAKDAEPRSEEHTSELQSRENLV